MKQIKTVMAALFIIAATSSCKKSKDIVAPSSSEQRVLKIEYPSNGSSQTFTYNASGRLVSAKDNSFTLNYNYASTPFGYEVFNSFNVKENDLANMVFTSNKMTSFDYQFYNASGVINGSETITVQYDANGYQTQKAYPGYIYTSTISGGNTVGLTKTNTNNGTTRTITYEYYTDKLNKLNINLFEYWYQDHILSDMEATGKKNSNLPKKITEVSPSSTRVTEFVYDIDASGLMKQYTATTTTNSGTPTSYSAKFSYQ